MRGDWQLTPWLTPRVPRAHGRKEPNCLSSLSRWKVLDNLRRSLVPIALLIWLLVGWAAGGAAEATLAVLGVLGLQGLFAAVAAVLRRPSEAPALGHVREIARALARQLLREAFALACLPYEAQVSCSAILRTSARVLLTGRHLLEWRTASDAQRAALTGFGGTYRVMLVAPLAALAGGLLTAPGELAVAAPVIVMWLSCPALAWWLSQPLRAAPSDLGASDEAFLRVVARRTWRFFETFVVEQESHLPPDNVQEDPPRGVAHRTSPTNIGLALTANLAAYDFGYLSSAEVVERTARTLRTLDQLARYRGHFYNWYDTTTLEPLRPLYVSTVDSGNLIGHLLTLAAGIADMAEHAIFRARIFEGLRDTLDVIARRQPPSSRVCSRVCVRTSALLPARGRPVASASSGSRPVAASSSSRPSRCRENAPIGRARSRLNARKRWKS
jgi:hypothetical protein